MNNPTYVTSSFGALPTGGHHYHSTAHVCCEVPKALEARVCKYIDRLVREYERECRCWGCRARRRVVADPRGRGQ
jgi:hypothetical protein